MAIYNKHDHRTLRSAEYTIGEFYHTATLKIISEQLSDKSETIERCWA